jgi:membrane dipeptidase
MSEKLIDEDLSVHALDLHREAIVVDFHCDVVLATLPDSAYPIGGGGRRTLSERSKEGHVDLPRLLEGGVDCQVFSHFVEPIYRPIAPFRMLQVLGYSYSEIEKNSDKLEIITDPEKIYFNHGKKISVIIGFEGGEAIDEDLRLLRIFHRLGLRRLTLCWNNRNAIADGVRWQRSGGGLTEFGASVVEECNRLGIIVDVSHITDRGFWDVVEVSRDPIVASHSNCRALCPSMRNLTDDMIRAISEKKGVIGVNFAQFFLLDRKELESGKIPTVSTVVDHIDHIVEVTGSTDNIGLGSDFDGVPSVAQGLEDVSKLPNLTKELISRGYSDQDIKKILGENFIRIIRQVWK